jgi:hypothetical protein
MIILYGRTPSGKTTYFIEQHKNMEVRILHVSDWNELRRAIISTQSVMNDPLPTLINTWYDVDCKDLVAYQNYELYIETHYFENLNGLKIVGDGKNKHYYGLKNEHLIKTKKLFIKKEPLQRKNNVDWIDVLGTRYRYMQSLFPEIIK